VTKALALIGVPSSAAAHRVGQDTAPARLRAAGLVEQLQAADLEVHDCGDLPAARFHPDPSHPEAQSLQRVRSVATGVKDQVQRAVRSGFLPLVIGGDCTIEIGVLAGLLHHATGLGLLYADGHVDLNTPNTSPSGIFDGMGMAHIVGVGGAAPELSRLGPVYPLLAADKVVLFGYNPAEVDEAERRVLAGQPFVTFSVDQIRSNGVKAAREALTLLEDRADRIAVHLDVDVIDQGDFPATDVPQRTAGLPFDDTLECLEVFVSSAKLAALTIAEFNPEIGEETGSLATKFVARVVRALARGLIS
jgi:arginase